MSNPVVVARSKIGQAVQHGNAEAERAARQEMATAKLERAIREAIKSAPPITPEQRQSLVMLLATGVAT